MEQKINIGELPFRDKWDKHLTQYLKNCSYGDNRSNGIFRESNNGKDEVRHGYIIDIREGEEKLDLIKQYNILCYPEDFKELIGKPHTYAHHMNSSQVMCYNFFRPMLGEINRDIVGYYGRPTKELSSLIKIFTGEDINPSSAKCRFEYIDNSSKYVFIKAVPNGRGEASSFDFFIEDGDIKIFFEIKYTESEFGGWKETSDKSKASIANHYSYFESGYSAMIDDSIVILNKEKNCLKKSYTIFNRYYQLFRNILKVNSPNTHSIFIFPKANKSISKEFSEFASHKELFGEEMTNVKGIFWENLTNYMSDEFKEKYVNYLIP